MQFSVILGLAGLAAALPGGVTDKITPSAAAPSGCSGSFPGKFEVAIIELGKRDVVPEKRDTCGGESVLVASLSDGVLLDALSRTGYIASNFQFQFDGPPQAGALLTAGFSVCSNGSLALGGSTVFYQCLSGDFYNLYDRHWAAQCSPVHISVIACGSATQKGDGQVIQVPDGQIVGSTMVATTIVTVLPDGQPQVVPTSVAIPVCQIGDGQLQGHTTPCALVPLPTVTAKPVTQISDGQIQVPPPTAAVPPPAVSAPAPSAPAASAPAPTPVSSKPSAALTPTTAASVVPKPSAATSAPPSAAGAARLASSSSLGALVIGILGAIFFF
jgi:hypothetical protein